MQNSYQSETDASTAQDGTGPFIHRFCPSPAAPIPTTVPSAPVLVPKETWTSPPWKCLGLRIEEPIAFQLDFATSGTATKARYEASAKVLRDDGTHSTLLVKGRGTQTGDAEVTLLTLDGKAEDCTSTPCKSLCTRHDTCGADQICSALGCSMVPEQGRVSLVSARLISFLEQHEGAAMTEVDRIRVWRMLAVDSVEHPKRWQCEATCAETKGDLAAFHTCAAPCDKLP